MPTTGNQRADQDRQVRTHEHFMQKALALASKGIGCTSPNPLVGCVVVHDDHIIGEGWHEVFGKAHAEVNAINQALQRQAGSLPAQCTLYVTLEPCNHHGLTPPCTQAILAARIARVVYGLKDPNPRAAGGASFLEQNGVEVIGGVHEAEARFQNRFFLKHLSSKKPYVIVKSATSLDGKIATRTGHSQWITGPQARERCHQLRQAVDAIVVGADTVIADNPALTVRLPDALSAVTSIRHPRPVVLDSVGRVPLNSTLLSGESSSRRPIIATTQKMPERHRQKLEAHGVEVIILPANTDGLGIDPTALLEALGQRAMQSVMLEGGASVHGSFRDAGLIDEIWNFIAPKVVGGTNAPGSFAGLGCETLEQATHLHNVTIEKIGDDLLIRGLINPVTAAYYDKTQHKEQEES